MGSPHEAAAEVGLGDVAEMSDVLPSKEQSIPADSAVGRLRSVFDGTHPTAKWSRAHAEELFRIIEALHADLQAWRKGRVPAAETSAAPPCGCHETYPQLQPGRINH